MTRHSIPWEPGAAMPALDDDVWELYDVGQDWTQAHDLAKAMPEKLEELQRLWLIEATKHNVQKVGAGRVQRTMPMAFSADETTDVGRESGTPVSADYNRESSLFSGKVNWVQIDLGKDDHDHLISPEERLRLAMTRQ